MTILGCGSAHIPSIPPDAANNNKVQSECYREMQPAEREGEVLAPFPPSLCSYEKLLNTSKLKPLQLRLTTGEEPVAFPLSYSPDFLPTYPRASYILVSRLRSTSSTEYIVQCPPAARGSARKPFQIYICHDSSRLRCSLESIAYCSSNPRGCEWHGACRSEGAWRQAWPQLQLSSVGTRSILEPGF
ncbi:uncharacterized protein BP01DRAFT_212612 [Aspergillus saccharolyticus JOP 1030-1]|uniref:Uncharacterized protein n=1 Tax=Aspergillus saccharolyticus JOP 1030-1 TaxID=1450539 RepID=A0A318Z2B0_9EURO|nr:hypothetical protein BP01DRAFT_212612 [Aspergillus saccharolyticus JOP 1030-1]PYH40427.1 hypothetical protein BP01DRAFT_212612 [Aspergillus saccharolyticus JOP 1030-1]